ncbi:hypothetical protein VA7868_03229 [Vibrio aerogenes CECT 7868]|uniref:Serine/threonine protein kinase n=1 Tax=Vibrio aerogenes CECT 7868 TaxID=1216006 RepID=A0A1M5ZUK2_9VIBR|nr:hypothetical protein [Vibrio aerogenes]SHI27739.1 hypothetical protein VA7868_03229 [Vibrio aerogenes CECT 7868]
MLTDECNKIISESEPGVKKLIVDGNTYWLKIHGENKSTVIRKLSSVISRISLFSLFHTQSVIDSLERFEHEKAMLHYLKQQNFRVPDIDLEGPGYFVTHDEGIPLNQLDNTRVSQTLLNKVFLTFAQLHKKNIAHGRPALRDIIINDHNIPTLIDFEESMMDANPTLQARDIYILLMELYRREDINIQQKVNALLIWKSEVSDENWESLLKINKLIKRICILPKFVLLFKKKNKLSKQLLETVALFEHPDLMLKEPVTTF